MKKILLSLIILMSTLTFSITDYYNIKELKYDDNTYYLADSNAIDNTYIQEYLKKDDSFPNYKELISVSYIKDGENIKLNELVQTQIDFVDSLGILKFVNTTHTFEKNILLDEFLIESGTYEYDIYHYLKDNNGEIVLLQYSLREYVDSQEKHEKFINYIINNRDEMVAKFNKFVIHKLNVKNMENK
ncbi:hypothetical protein [Oceanivirga miroungae]|uniref:Uncharacterized protein n=1 Tax=Oceanivirga miroungae TaxID=1130046 RepID=A0A6I8M6Y1_9FUSO|nr:hypothetical protein [Oceanivirga miroungae]VWL85247.1 hypothetical protein OMES3154_00530 [Oceanivirga miroungae]